VIPGRAELQIAVESLRGSTKRARKTGKACIACFSLIIIISPVVDYSLRSKINTILDLSTQTNTMYKIIKILFIFCNGVDEVLIIFCKNLSKIIVIYGMRVRATCCECTIYKYRIEEAVGTNIYMPKDIRLWKMLVHNIRVTGSMNCKGKVISCYRSTCFSPWVNRKQPRVLGY